MEVASQRLIAAAAALDPGDRALLSLLVNHGLDDEGIARVTHSSVDVIVARRQRMTERLSAILGLPPSDVSQVLRRLSGTARSHANATADGRTTIRWIPWGAAMIAALVVAGVVVLIVVLSGGGSTRTRHTPLPTVRATLTALPGGPKGVNGSLSILGSSPHVRLTLHVGGLPSAHGGHYEAWLYNSIIDSRPLGPVGAPDGDLSASLPVGYRHFRWLDISLQPPGLVNHSGLSIVRAAIP
jgi:hypothetical protein